MYFFIYGTMDLVAILNVTLVTHSDELLFALISFRSAHLNCHDTLLYFSVQNIFIYK